MANEYKRTSTEELTAMADSIREVGTFTEGQTFVFPSSEYDQNPTITYYEYDNNSWTEITEEQAAQLSNTEYVAELPVEGVEDTAYILTEFQMGFAEAYEQAIQEFWDKVYHGTLTQDYIDDIIFDQPTKVFDSNVAGTATLSYPNITKLTMTPHFASTPEWTNRLQNVEEVIIYNPNNEEVNIGNDKFNGFKKLTTIKCSPINIGLDGFNGCLVLELGPESLNLSKCESIGTYAFAGTTFQSVTLPAITNIESNAFYNNQNLIEVHLPSSPPSLKNVNAFYIKDMTMQDIINPNLRFYIPSGTLSNYTTAENWSAFTNYFVEEAVNNETSE